MSRLVITTIAPVYFDALQALQRIVYPTLGVQELMSVEHFASQARIFPEGQFVALVNDEVVGQGSGFFINFDFNHPRHTFRDICAGFHFTNHDPDGEYYYGADISVHPDYRGQGIGRKIYEARKALVKRTNRRGIVAGGLLPGYATVKDALSLEAYVNEVLLGARHDSTLSFQLHMGFEVRGLIPDYIEDSATGNWATLIEWVNPCYMPRQL